MYKMKKDCFKNFTSAQFVFKMVLMLFAVVTGGGVLAMADTAEPTTQIGDEGNEPSSKADAATTYVAKVTGKDLSDNNFTTELLTKLNGIEAGANRYVLPQASSTVLGGVTVGNNITVNTGTISVSKENVIAALGYTPSDSAAEVPVEAISDSEIDKLFASGK